jgi:hypothetical protein
MAAVQSSLFRAYFGCCDEKPEDTKAPTHHRALGEGSKSFSRALTEWRLQNAGWVRNVVAHDVKQEPIETATSPLWLRLQPNRFSLVIDFERLED